MIRRGQAVFLIMVGGLAFAGFERVAYNSEKIAAHMAVEHVQRKEPVEIWGTLLSMVVADRDSSSSRVATDRMPLALEHELGFGTVDTSQTLGSILEVKHGISKPSSCSLDYRRGVCDLARIAFDAPESFVVPYDDGAETFDCKTTDAEVQ